MTTVWRGYHVGGESQVMVMRNLLFGYINIVAGWHHKHTVHNTNLFQGDRSRHFSLYPLQIVTT